MLPVTFTFFLLPNTLILAPFLSVPLFAQKGMGFSTR